jgi:hypothetical protein
MRAVLDREAARLGGDGLEGKAAVDQVALIARTLEKIDQMERLIAEDQARARSQTLSPRNASSCARRCASSFFPPPSGWRRGRTRMIRTTKISSAKPQEAGQDAPMQQVAPRQRDADEALGAGAAMTLQPLTAMRQGWQAPGAIRCPVHRCRCAPGSPPAGNPARCGATAGPGADLQAISEQGPEAAPPGRGLERAADLVAAHVARLDDRALIANANDWQPLRGPSNCRRKATGAPG